MCRTAAADAAAAECRAQLHEAYPGLRTPPDQDLLLLCPVMERYTPFAVPCKFKTNDLRALRQHFRQFPQHQRGRVPVRFLRITYDGDESQVAEHERHVIIGPHPQDLL